MSRMPRMSRALATAALVAPVLTITGCATRAEGLPGEGAAMSPPSVTGSPVRVAFVASEPAFAEAVREYERIWAEEGARIVAAMEAASGLTFAAQAYADTAIVARTVR